MSKDTGGPAFPFAATDTSNEHMQAHGMTLRDYFAAKAMQAWLSTFTESRHPAETGNSILVAKSAYAIADAMLEARIV